MAGVGGQGVGHLLGGGSYSIRSSDGPYRDSWAAAGQPIDLGKDLGGLVLEEGRVERLDLLSDEGSLIPPGGGSAG